MFNGTSAQCRVFSAIIGLKSLDVCSPTGIKWIIKTKVYGQYRVVQKLHIFVRLITSSDIDQFDQTFSTVRMRRNL